MNMRKQILTNNACFKAGHIITPMGIMVHSTGANNPWLKRYVAPDDGLLGKNENGNHWNQDAPDGRMVCVHAFIGKLTDGSIATYQTLPWQFKAWHAGGSANNSFIGFEICEDTLADSFYFRMVFSEAVELCVYLCRLFGLTETDILCHSEGYTKGIASNHADVMHWFPRHGEDMDSFRAAVKSGLREQEIDEMKKEDFDKLMNDYDPLYMTLSDVPLWWREDAEALIKAGAIKGDGVDSFGIRQSILKAAIISKRYTDSIK